MKKIIIVLKIIKIHLFWRWIRHFFYQRLSSRISNKFILKFKYLKKFKKCIDFEKPHTFNEKLQYLKLTQTDNIFTELSDKYRVREYVQTKIWPDVLTELYWVWVNPDKINFDILPKSFVIKCNHGSGYNIIVKNKNELNIKSTISQLKKWMREDYWKYGRELQYKNINKKIIIEQFLYDTDTIIPKDYKFWTFNWEPKYMNIHFEEEWIWKINIYNKDYEIQNFWMVYPNNINKCFTKPLNFNKMLEYSKILSEDLVFTRIDFYEVNWKIYFWEITFYPTGWLVNFYPDHNKLDKKYWDLINIKKIKKI